MEVQIEGFGQVEGPFVGRELMDLAPEVQHISGGSARRMKALEDIFGSSG